MGLVSVKCDSEERAESMKETVKDRPLKGLIYSSAAITVEKILKG